MLRISDLRYGAVKNSLWNWSIWNELLPDYNITPENYERDNLNLIKTIDSLNAEANQLRSEFHNREPEVALLPFALRQAKFAVSKNLLGIKLKNYVQTNVPRNISYFEKDFAVLTDTINQLKTVYTNLWQLENRNWWLDTVRSYSDSFPQTMLNQTGACIIVASGKPVNGKREITLRSAFNNLPVYYTTDTSTPNINSIKYTQPILADTGITIRARVIDNGRSCDVQTDSFVFHKAIGMLHKLNSRWDTARVTYAARGELGLLDGRRGGRKFFNDGRWQAYFGSDIDIELDLGAVTPVNKITMGFGQLMRYGIMYPKQIEVSTSPDGINYTLVNTTVNTIDGNTEARSTHDYVIPFTKLKARYIKIVAKSIGPLPDWHYSKGTKSWLYADEIIVE